MESWTPKRRKFFINSPMCKGLLSIMIRRAYDYWLAKDVRAQISRRGLA